MLAVDTLGIPLKLHLQEGLRNGESGTGNAKTGDVKKSRIRVVLLSISEAHATQRI